MKIIPIRHTSGLYRFCSTKDQKQYYVATTEQYRKLFLKEIEGENYVDGVSQLRVKNSNAIHQDVPIGITMSYSTKSNGQNETTSTPQYTSRGNLSGRYASWINKQYVTVNFGDRRSQEQALKSLIAYKRANSYPPHCYFDVETDTLIKFELPDDFKEFHKKREESKRTLYVYFGIHGKKGFKQYSKSGDRVGNFHIKLEKLKKYAFGERRSVRETLHKICDDVSNFTKYVDIEYYDGTEFVLANIQDPESKEVLIQYFESYVESVK